MNTHIDRWPHREAFRSSFDAWKAREGITSAQAADRFGVSVGQLNLWLYGKSRPMAENIMRMSAVMGEDSRQFIDDPGGAPDGFEAAEFQAMSVEDRMMVRLMVEDMKRIPAGDKRKAFDAWTAVLRVFGLI